MAAPEVDVLVIGGANSDYLVRGRELPRRGTTVQGESFLAAAGGKGANAAVAAARLGARVGLIACIGADDRGRDLLGVLDRERVDVGCVVTDEHAPTGVALVMVERGGEKQIMVAPGANLRLTAEHVHACAARIANARAVLVQLEICDEAVEMAAQLGRAAGARVVLDPAPPRPLAETLLCDLHVLRPNAAEAEALTGIEVTDRASARRAADNLIERGAAAVVVGAPGGDLLVEHRSELWIPHFPVDAIDATGAGDAYAAALAVMLGEGEDLAAAARFASATAALATTAIGAQTALPSRDQVHALLARV